MYVGVFLRKCLNQSSAKQCRKEITMDMTSAKMNVKLSYSRWDFIFSLAFFLFISISLLRWWINTGDSSQILLITNTHCDDNFTSLNVTHNLIPTNQPRDKVPSTSPQLCIPKRWKSFFFCEEMHLKKTRRGVKWTATLFFERGQPLR